MVIVITVCYILKIVNHYEMLMPKKQGGADRPKFIIQSYISVCGKTELSHCTVVNLTKENVM